MVTTQTLIILSIKLRDNPGALNSYSNNSFIMVSNPAQFLRANLLKLEEEANYCPQLVAWLVGLLAVFCFGANEFAFFENEKYDSNPYKGFFLIK